jgi:hypothetical protein
VMDDWELEPPDHKRASPPGSPPSAPVPAGSPQASPVVPRPAQSDSFAGTGALPEVPALQEGAPEDRPALQDGASPVRRSSRLRRAHPAVLTGIAVVILLAGMMIGFFIARGQTSGDSALLADARGELSQLQKALSQAEDRNWAYYRANEALRTQLEKAMTGGSTSTTVPGPVRPAGAYGDGVYLVGEDIAPGTYDGTVDGSFGYWARLKSTDGLTSAIIANAIVRGPFVLEIYVADRAVELRGVTITSR